MHDAFPLVVRECIAKIAPLSGYAAVFYGCSQIFFIVYYFVVALVPFSCLTCYLYEEEIERLSHSIWWIAHLAILAVPPGMFHLMKRESPAISLTAMLVMWATTLVWLAGQGTAFGSVVTGRLGDCVLLLLWALCSLRTSNVPRLLGPVLAALGIAELYAGFAMMASGTPYDSFSMVVDFVFILSIGWIGYILLNTTHQNGPTATREWKRTGTPHRE